MSRSLTRTAALLLTAIVLSLAIHAGELVRPVPSNAQVTRFTRFNIRYTLRDIIAEGVQKVDFYITDDMGGTWNYYGEDPDKVSPMTVEVPGEGVYGFVCVVTDRHGNREREPGPRTIPETVIVVDRTPPSAKWLAPATDILGRGQTIEFSWESSDEYFGDAPVTLQYAANAQSNLDRNANWQNIREKLPANGAHKWTPPSSAAYNFRLVAEDRAGNAAIAYCAATARVDNTPPYITSVSPLRSNKLDNDIVVEAKDNDGGSGVKEYSLYVSDNGSATWTLLKEAGAGGESEPIKRAPGQPIVWKAQRSGEYPLWPVVFDEAGNATPLPAVAVAGPYILVIDTEPPQVVLSSSFLEGRAAILANEPRRVEWTAYDPHIRESSARILLSLDNGDNWQELRSGLPVNGFETINFPFGSQSEEAKLKVAVEDEFGNTGESVSETFKLSGAETTIDSVTPHNPPAQSPSDPFGIGSAPSPLPPQTGGDNWFGGDSAAPAFDSGFGSGFDSPAPAPAVPLPTTPSGGDIFGGGADIYGGFNTHSGESTAGSLPRAMLDRAAPSGGGLSGGFTPPPPSGGISLPPPPADGGFALSPPGSDMFGASSAPAPTTAPDAGWTASPGAGLADAGSATQQWTAPSDTGGLDSAWTPSTTGTAIPAPPPTDPVGGGASIPSSGAGLDLASLLGGSTSPEVTPPAVPVTPTSVDTPPASDVFGQWESPQTPPADTQPFAGFGDDGGFAPPPVQTQQSDIQFPGFDQNAGGLSLDGLGDGNLAQGLDLPSATPPPASPAAPDQSFSLRPPGVGDTTPPAPAAPAPDAPPATGGGSQPWPAVSDAMPPVTPAAPPPTVPTLPNDDSSLSLPQPLQTRSDQRPANPRQLADHYIKESKAYRDDNQPNLARDSAQKAVEADPRYAAAYMELSQVSARMDPPDYVTAANLAKEATNLQADWETWWNCADVFYTWAHASNREIQALMRSGQNPPINLIDERNQTLSNALIAVNNAASVLPQGDRAAAKKVAVTQGMIAYLRALSVPEPQRPMDDSPASADDYRRRQGEYKLNVSPLLVDAIPYFQNALNIGGPPEYSELFQLGIINFRLGNLERDTGNMQQAINYYQDAINYLEQATTAANAPKEGPREAYYMLALCHDQLASQPGPNRARHRELALRYWRQTADFYEPDSPYRIYAEERIDSLGEEMGL